MPVDAGVRPGAAGTRTVNLNRRKFLFWPTTCQLTEVVPERKLAFRVNENNTVWSYELEPTATAPASSRAGTPTTASSRCRTSSSTR